MEIFNDVKGMTYYPNLVVALGNFDGVHLGHQELIARACKRAQEIHGTAALFTLDPHPLQILQPESNPFLLLSKDEKITRIAQQGIKVMVVAGFDKAMALLDPEQFINQVIVQGLQAKVVIVGYNYSFGKGGKGNPELLRQYAEAGGYQVEVVPPVTFEGKEVSSTSIRQHLLQGNMRQAYNLLGYYPYLTGNVVTGAQLGRKLGFPTANLNVPVDLLIPANGVYAVNVIHRGRQYHGVANIGFKPTLKSEQPKNVEINIFDFCADIYGEPIRVEFVTRIREEKQFNGLVELKEQILKDAQQARDLLAAMP